MSISTNRLCEVRGFLRRCRSEALGLCQYCGRRFCAEHGVRYADGQEICGRKVCQQKAAELPHHLEYKAQVRQLNSQGHCGISGCVAPPWGQCSACGCFFCREHVQPRTRTVRVGMVIERRPTFMCDHCWDRRRRIWSRT